MSTSTVPATAAQQRLPYDVWYGPGAWYYATPTGLPCGPFGSREAAQNEATRQRDGTAANEAAAAREARLAAGVRLEHDDGWAVMVTTRRSDSGPGWRGGETEVDEVGDPWVTDADTFRAARGCEPTDEALAAALADAERSDWILDAAIDAAEDS